MEHIEIEEYDGTGWVVRQYPFDIAGASTVADDDVDLDMRRITADLVYYGEAAGKLKAEAERKEANVERVAAILAQKFRQASPTKLTNDYVKELVLTDQDYRDALTEASWSRLKQVRVESWYQALKRKTDVIIALTYKHTAEIKKLY